jgi:hypothetical protein
MRRTATSRLPTLALILIIAAPAGAQDKQPPEEVQKTEAAVKADLAKLKGTHAQLIFKDEPVLKKVFPEHVFVVARFRLFPVANQIPEGLRASNVFAVTKKEHRTYLIRDARELELFFKATEVPVKNDAAARSALAAWLVLLQESRQDGFYKFEILEKDFASETNDKREEVRGRAIVTQGGKGEIGATLVFDNGKLAKATETGKIMPGPRPICQATKLLDRDPIVHKMAEQDLLFMGLAARDYLMEQREKAGPELREAIDRLWRRIRAEGW